MDMLCFGRAKKMGGVVEKRGKKPTLAWMTMPRTLDNMGVPSGFRVFPLAVPQFTGVFFSPQRAGVGHNLCSRSVAAPVDAGPKCS